MNGVYVVAPEEYTAGFVLRGTGSTVKGLVVNGFNDGGVRITGTGATSPGPRISTGPARTSTHSPVASAAAITRTQRKSPADWP